MRHALSMAFLTLTLLGGTLAAVAADDPAADAGWLNQAQEWIESSEYHFKFEGSELSAPNRRHDLRSFVDPDGLRVESRTAGRDGFELSLIPRRWLRGDQELEVGPGLAFGDAQRAELRRDGWTEWFVNLEDGLKHGMTLDGPPLEGAGPLTLSFELGPEMQAYVNEDGTAVEFKQPSNGTSLRYADLLVLDALERPLPARMVVDRLELRIEFDDRDAVYPVTVDPLLTTVARSYQGNQGGAWMGYSLSTAGDVNGDGYSDVIIGTPLYDAGQVNEGKVFVFHGSSSGLNVSSSWTVESDIQSAQLGLAVSTAGDVNNDGFHDVLVATHKFSDGQSSEGKAWAYLGSAGGLQSGAAWKHESNRILGQFGFSVSAAGDVNNDGFDDIVVGEPGYSVGVSNRGAVHLFLGNSGGVNDSETTFTGEVADGQSGWDVSGAGDLNADGYEDFLSGAPFSDSGQNDEGLVYVYFGAGSPGQINITKLQRDQPFARFGISVANAGDVNGDGRADVLVGAEFWDNGATLNTGGAFVFHGTSGGISSTPAQTFVGQVNSLFGQTVSTAGDVDGDGYADIMIGAPSHDNENIDEGRVVVYLGSAAGFGAPWSSEGNQDNASYGAAIATAGDVNGDGYSDVMIGAYRFDEGSVDEGKVFVYHGSPGELQQGAGWTTGGGQANANLGFSVSAAGDVNWDGFSDVIVGAPYYDAGQSDEGQAYVFHGSASGLSATPNTTLEENQAAAKFGWAVSDAGDVNGDGYDDVFVGAPSWDNGQTDEGRVFLYLGGGSGIGAAGSWTAESDDAFAQFGFSISRAGDVNRDGFGDLLVGAYAYGSGVHGAAFVYHGGTSLSASPDWSYVSSVDGWLGYSVSGGGDINRDGFSDILVGAPYYNASTDGGRVLIFRGGSGGLSGSPDQTLDANQPDAEFGFSVAYAGDLNRDGYADFLVGAPLYEVDLTDEGVVFAIRGSATTASTLTLLQSNIVGTCFGCSVGGAGDVNGDGYDDALTGSYTSNQGRVTLWHGSAGGLGSSPAWSNFGTLAGDEYGRSLDGAGDVNGDGFGDVIVGAPNYEFTSGIAHEGEAFVYYGGGVGLSQELRQSGGVATTPVALLGRSDDDNSFRVRYRARSAAGRSRVRMLVEAYDSTNGALAGETLTGFFRTSAPGTGGSTHEFWEHVLNLQDGPDYRWIVRSIGRNPYFPRTPWRWMAGNGELEKDISTTCVPVSWYEDVDGDGFGDPATVTLNCTLPAGYIADGTDCDDGDGAINPDATEIICDGIDQNCNGGSDEAPDTDSDGIDVCDVSDPANSDGVGVDNCPDTANPSQQDSDGDGEGDPCDLCPNDAANDIDADGVCGDVDNCPFIGNPTQTDSDADGVGDVCDICVFASDPGQEDGDADGTGDVCDNCPVDNNPTQLDTDGDTFGDACDCAAADGTTWALSGPVVNLTLSSSGGQTTLSWDPPLEPGADVGALAYDVLAAFNPDDFVGLALCLSIDQSATSYIDTLTPGTGQMFSYLVRAQNACGEGSNGLDDQGQERNARSCN